MSGIRLLYVTYNENPIGSGIVRVQVRRMLEELAGFRDVEAIEWLAFISPRLRRRLAGSLDEFSRHLQLKGVGFSVRRMFAASAWGWSALPIMLFYSLPVLKHRMANFKPTVIHSRSYAAALLSHMAVPKGGAPVVFDPRGPYPEEMVMNKTWRRDGISFRIWKILESRLIRECAAVIGVTPDYRDEFRARGARRALFVPNRCDLAAFHDSIPHQVDAIPKIVFLGEMDSRWYSPAYVARHFLNIRSFIPNARLLIITRWSSERIKMELLNAGLNENMWEVKSAEPQDVFKLLQEGSLGLVVQNFDNAWPTKFGEYLAAGLPVILNRRAGQQIGRVVTGNSLGIVVDVDQPNDYAGVTDLLDNLPEVSGRCIAYAHKRLGIERSARQHLRLYHSLGA